MCVWGVRVLDMMGRTGGVHVLLCHEEAEPVLSQQSWLLCVVLMCAHCLSHSAVDVTIPVE